MYLWSLRTIRHYTNACHLWRWLPFQVTPIRSLEEIWSLLVLTECSMTEYQSYLVKWGTISPHLHPAQDWQVWFQLSCSLLTILGVGLQIFSVQTQKHCRNYGYLSFTLACCLYADFLFNGKKQLVSKFLSSCKSLLWTASDLDQRFQVCIISRFSLCQCCQPHPQKIGLNRGEKEWRLKLELVYVFKNTKIKVSS